MSTVVVVVGAWDDVCWRPSAGVGAADAEDQILMATSDMTTKGHSRSFLCSIIVGSQVISKPILEDPVKNWIKMQEDGVLMFRKG